MDLIEWRTRRAQGVAMETPSGLKVRLRRLRLLDLAEQGRIPAPLVGAADNLMERGTPVGAENVGEIMEVVNLVVSACLVEPQVGVSGDDQIAIDELPVADRLAIYTWAHQEVMALAPFREEDGQPGGAGPAGAPVRDTTKPAAGDSGRVHSL